MNEIQSVSSSISLVSTKALVKRLVLFAVIPWFLGFWGWRKLLFKGVFLIATKRAFPNGFSGKRLQRAIKFGSENLCKSSYRHNRFTNLHIYTNLVRVCKTCLMGVRL